MAAKRRMGKRWVRGWLLILGASGVPLATSVTCDSSDFSLTVFRDRGQYSGGFVDVFFEDDLFFHDDLFFDDCFFDDCF